MGRSSHLGSQYHLAEQLQASGLKIYTVGIGADPTEAESQSDLDETTLEQIAQITGGQYFQGEIVNVL